MILPNISEFIQKHITHRKESFFREDLENNKKHLLTEIKGKSVLVIGGAGTIGSSFIKAALKFYPSKLVVVVLSVKCEDTWPVSAFADVCKEVINNLAAALADVSFITVGISEAA